MLIGPENALLGIVREVESSEVASQISLDHPGRDGWGATCLALAAPPAIEALLAF
jgi:hypothetical protein